MTGGATNGEKAAKNGDAAAAKPVIAVVGATGDQGGGAVKALQKQGKFHIRALTRNAEAEKAKALAAQGIEVVQADLADKASLVKAFQGAYGLFLVTDFWGGAGMKAEVEIQHGKNAGDAAKEAGIQHVVFSSLDDVLTVVPDVSKYQEVEPGSIIPHFETKVVIQKYLESLGLPLSIILTTFFHQNYTKFFPFQKQEDGSYTWANNSGSNAKLGHEDVNDIGETAAVLFGDREKYLGATVPSVGDFPTATEAAEILSRVTGLTIKYTELSDDVQRGLGYPGAIDLGNMFQWYRTEPYFNEHRPIDKVVYRGLTLEQWAHANKDVLIKHITTPPQW